MRISAMSVTVCSVFLTASAFAQAPAGENDVFVRELHPRAIVVGSGETYGDTVLALESEQGLVVVDTGTTTSFTRAYRKKIEEFFERDDFAYVINTHYHYDHTIGNQVFPEATVVASERTRERLVEWYGTLPAFVSSQRVRVEGWKRAAAGLVPGDERAARLRDIESTYSRMCDDLESDFELHLPTITFSDRIHLDLGDLTLNLFAYGPGAHTGDDILVHVPEVGVVATGDLFHHEYVQPIFSLEPGIDLAHMVEVLDSVLADEGVQFVVPVHSRTLSRSELEARRSYMAGMWEAIQALIEEGGTLADARDRLSLENEFADLAELGITPESLATQHDQGLTMVWLAAKGAQDAAVEINRALEDGGAESAKVAFRRILPLKDDEYYVDENAFNNLGYRLLGEHRLDEAVAVFEMNTEAYPESANTYDSLGEALAARGEIEKAIANYRRSLELDPDNTNASAQIERLETLENGDRAQ